MDQKLEKEEAKMMQVELKEELSHKFNSYEAKLKGTLLFIK